MQRYKGGGKTTSHMYAKRVFFFQLTDTSDLLPYMSIVTLHNTVCFYSRVKKEQRETDFTPSEGPDTPITSVDVEFRFHQLYFSITGK